MRFLFAIILSLTAAYALGLYLAIPVNPEVKLWREVVKKREWEIAEVRKTHPSKPIMLFTGGSSCAFSIDPEIVEKTCGIPAFNLGLPVSAGATYLIHQALEQTRPGDILVICLEPDLLTSVHSERHTSKFSFAMSAMAGNVTEAGGGSTFDHALSIPDYLNYSRPGANYLATLMARVITGRGYRYTSEDIRYHGRMETAMMDQSLQPNCVARAQKLSMVGADILTKTVAAAKKRNILIIYSMPWRYTAPEYLEEIRHNNRKVLEDISRIMPVLEDGLSGATCEKLHYSDSGLHLSKYGSDLRSHALAQAVHSRLLFDYSKDQMGGDSAQ